MTARAEVGMVLRDRTARWWAVVLGVLVLAGVGIWLVAAPAAAGVPDEFTDRTTLPDCGRADVTEGPADARGQEAIDCLDAALADGRGAELVVVFSTAEGDPITEYFRALPGGGMEIFSDNRQDAFRGVDWHHTACPEARSYLERGDCGYRDL